MKESFLREEAGLVWEPLEVEHIEKNQWIDFRRTTYRLPDGAVSKPVYTYSRRNYVVIVAVDEAGKYLCVRQFRQGIGAVTTEFPAGGIERSDGRDYGGSPDLEDILEAAKRELREETGCVSDCWTHLLSVPSNATIADNYAHLILAEKCRKIGGLHLDDGEFLNDVVLSGEEIEGLVARGQFQQASHILAYFMAKEKLAGGAAENGAAGACGTVNAGENAEDESVKCHQRKKGVRHD